MQGHDNLYGFLLRILNMKNRETQKRFGREETHGECAVNGSHEPGVTVSKWKPGGSRSQSTAEIEVEKELYRGCLGGTKLGDASVLKLLLDG